MKIALLIVLVLLVIGALFFCMVAYYAQKALDEEIPESLRSTRKPKVPRR